MTTAVDPTGTSAPPAEPGMVAMDVAGRIRIPRAGAITAAILRIGIGLIYLWAFISQGFGVGYTNQVVNQDAPSPTALEYHWHFSYDSDAGWITSGFDHSPTEQYVDNNTHGPLAFIPQDLPVGLVDFGWIFAIGGLGIALTFGICSRIAGWGGLILNIMIWFSVFPPSNNPVFDAEHFMFAFIIFLLMWLHASNYWGIGRWWRAKTPAFLN
jgi:thiosulfate dehydrogenase (quinone) large subunit